MCSGRSYRFLKASSVPRARRNSSDRYGLGDPAVVLRCRAMNQCSLVRPDVGGRLGECAEPDWAYRRQNALKHTS
jgi:hypothetical protein